MLGMVQEKLYLKLSTFPHTDLPSVKCDIFPDRLKGYFVEDQFVGETPPANLAAAEASSQEDQSSK